MITGHYPFKRQRLLRNWLLAAGLAALLGGCAGQPPVAPAPTLSALPAAAAQTQRLTFYHRHQRRELLGILRHDDQSLRLALLSPQGQRLLTLVRDAQGARFLPGAQFEPPFSADWLANRLFWSLWPTSAVSEAFQGSDWTLETTPTDRSIRYRGQLVARITDHTGCRVIDDIEGGYRLQIIPINAANDRTPDACPAD